MSKLSKAVKQKIEENSLRRDETVMNFMGGDSYEINPFETMKMVTASSIFGEPSYYRDSKSTPKTYDIHSALEGYTILNDSYAGKTTDDIMTELIDGALDYDFKGTLEWAIYLRNEYNMRLNPQVIMVRAAIHPKREEFTKENPGLFDEINQKIMGRADEAMTQMAYYLYLNDGKKNNIPSVIKRSWAKNLSKQSRYKVAKYKNHEIGMINAVRLCHANSPVIDELMRTGTVEITEDEKTWENLKSDGKTWREILDTIDMGHMALLRNLRNIFEEIEDQELCKKYLDKLKAGVVNGKQFPFRYYAAMNAIKESNECHHKPLIIDALEECMDIAIVNFPKLKGKTMCLSDNSGSAWGGFTSEYGRNTVATIDNLSSVMTAMSSDEGYVGKFGDRLIIHPISKRMGILQTAENISKGQYNDCGGHTEGGIWEFFKNAIEKNEYWDNIFIYSDQQAGHGGLYGTTSQEKEYGKEYAMEGRSYCLYINVFKLIQEYRKKVNPKVNVFSIQTAGYNNILIPEMAYRTAIMYGWTGKEAVFANEYISQWDELEKQKSEK
jgi:hypothetical protein